MSGRLAILACAGALPVRLAAAYPDAMQITLEGVPSALDATAQRHRLEKLGTLFEALEAQGVTRLVFAGAMKRPAINPAACDALMLSLAPRIMMTLPKGDDAVMRLIIDIFEEQGLEIIGAHELLPDLLAEEGLAMGPTPSSAEVADVARAQEILNTLSPLDIGQGCVVAGGLCLGIETLQGTDALLGFVAQTAPELRRGHKGVYVKAAKRGQDLRMDMPTIGPRTIHGVAEAGLAGLVVEAGKAQVLDREAVVQAVEDTGIFLISQAL